MRDIFFSLAKLIALIKRKKHLKIVEHVLEYIRIMDGFCFILIPHKAFSIKTVAGLVILDILCEKENIVIVLK